jgi:2-polyprenyl-6-methoxyphenol hydroxylase-like FAD-dependent oxidoreductase
MTQTHQPKHALVIGASMAGLLAARALADTFSTVTLLERDELPSEPANRRGVPQGLHTHGLLAGGRQALEELYPGITDEVVADGALTGDLTADVRWCLEGRYHRRFRSGLVGVCVSRPVLEYHVRARTLALPNVALLEQAEALGLEATEDRSRVSGVRVRGVPGQADDVLRADLVVDASGRGSRSLAWLERLGHARPVEERVEVGVSYTTRYYRRDPRQLDGDLGVVVAATPDNTRGGVLLAQEGGRWVATLAGIGGDAARSNEADFLAFARTLPVPEIADVVARVEPVTDFLTTRFPANQRRRFERLERVPAGFIAFGDAICSFNPVYGQGMTVAAVEARVLRRCLAQGLDDLPRRFYAAASPLVDAPWSVAVGNDLRMPGVEGPRTRMVRFVNWYLERLNRAAHHDAALALAFQRVANLLAPPPSILAPPVALRVLGAGLRSGGPKAARARQALGPA